MEKPNVEDRLTQLENFEKEHIQAHRELMEQLKPITDAFNNANGFSKVSIMILKALGYVGVGVGVLYGLYNFLKK